MHLQPLHDNVLIEFDPAPGETEGGIILPDAESRPEPGIATVLAVGPGAEVADPNTGKLRVLPPPAVNVGDRVIALRYCGMVVPPAMAALVGLRPGRHKRLRVLRGTEILAVAIEENEVQGEPRAEGALELSAPGGHTT